MFKDKDLSCKDCGKSYVFSASEQEFFAQKGFKNEPSRCPECRSAKKAQGNSHKFGQKRTQREMFPATCATCGKTTSVPFQPTGEKPVYCQDCYQPRKRNSW
jgi:CxxC-x17-CxxC domain-containing protein